MNELFRLKNGKTVFIKRLYKKDYEINNNYEFVYNWLHDISEYLALDFEKKNLEQNKTSYYQMILNEELYIVLGALSEEKIIATAHLTLNPPTMKSGHVGTWGISINPNFQDQGLGKRLLELLENIALKKGLKKLHASYYAANKKAEHLYINRMKYEIEGRQKLAALLKNGSYTDIMLIGKILDDKLTKKS